MASLPQPYLTPEEYLERERAAETKSEYFNGEMFAMAGATRRHNLIGVNLSRELSFQLKGRPCEVYSGDMRVRITNTGLYTYPDVTVVCGEPEFLDERQDTLLNPTVLIEVLSSSTEAYDRGEKAAQYRRLESLTDHILIAQDRIQVEQYTRQRDGGRWLFAEADDLNGFLELAAIGCRVALSEIYDKVRFDTAGERSIPA